MKHYTRNYYSNCLIEAIRIILRGKARVFLIMKTDTWYSPFHFACFDRDNNFWHFRNMRGVSIPPLFIKGRIEGTSRGKLLWDRRGKIYQKSILFKISF